MIKTGFRGILSYKCNKEPLGLILVNIKSSNYTRHQNSDEDITKVIHIQRGDAVEQIHLRNYTNRKERTSDANRVNV